MVLQRVSALHIVPLFRMIEAHRGKLSARSRSGSRDEDPSAASAQLPPVEGCAVKSRARESVTWARISVGGQKLARDQLHQLC